MGERYCSEPNTAGSNWWICIDLKSTLKKVWLHRVGQKSILFKLYFSKRGKILNYVVSVNIINTNHNVLEVIVENSIKINIF